ncbi:unnamed protein product [Symbiodinium microadriaticum]|nr:unnamed protein product [Symbiodinium sp. KB8]CAE7299289.1 unnamed protein product [Symbiodinium microadriaticum]
MNDENVQDRSTEHAHSAPPGGLSWAPVPPTSASSSFSTRCTDAERSCAASRRNEVSVLLARSISGLSTACLLTRAGKQSIYRSPKICVRTTFAHRFTRN